MASNNPQFVKILKQMEDIHKKKGEDYADDNPYSNFEGAAHIAGCSVDTVFRVLLGIKMERLRVLTASTKAPNNESIQDSRIDLATYAALYAAYHTT